MGNNLVAPNNKTSGGETKSAKQEIEKITKRLKRLRETRDYMDESVDYAASLTLCANGVDWKVYHGQCLILNPEAASELSHHFESAQDEFFVHI
jgi:hypothetical protein